MAWIVSENVRLEICVFVVEKNHKDAWTEKRS